ncbi:MAG: hypothetical protein K9M49_05655 [Candidatus Marinimicrobia bacterium]|nr:hypothetical protein [Candidatus Neomarinimicrobiota bacterium]MCF7904623.1 hypothetical protein [Candidatus Neomarinimicrobiota bacterium]
MKLLLRLTPVLLVIMGLFLFVGCEETDDPVNPLVGTWNISSLSQIVTAMAGDSLFVDMSAAYGAAYSRVNFAVAGDTLGETTTVPWTTFQALGVNGAVTMKEDETFTLSGDLPIASDTLGVAPSTTFLSDAGGWEEGEYEGTPTLTIDGAFYDLGGLLTWSDDENTITLSYQTSSTDSMYVPVDVGFAVLYGYGPVTVVTQGALEFTRQ